MSRSDRRGEPLDRIVGLLRERDDARRTTTFLRGLTLGAIVGAAVAGSTIWSRWRRNRAGSAPDPSASGREDGLG